jgi:hypothetical protein
VKESIVAVVAGFITTAVLVAVSTTIAARLLIGDAGSVSQAPLPATYLAANLILGFLSAGVGGFTCAWIASHSRAVHVGVLAGLLGLLSLATALTSGPGPGQPPWYPWVIGAIGIAGIVVGGAVRLWFSGNPA